MLVVSLNMLDYIIILNLWTTIKIGWQGRIVTELSAECVCLSDPLLPDIFNRV